MQNYMCPPIPNGFTHVRGAWNKSFIIQDEKTKSCFTWIPLFILPDASDTLKCIKETSEGYGQEFELSVKTINMYGGIYVSTYPISKDNFGKPVSKESKFYWNRIAFKRAKSEAQRMRESFKHSDCFTHLIFGWEFDEILKCIIKLANKSDITNSDFEEYGLYGITEIWSWTLKKRNEFSNIIKIGVVDSSEEFFANNDFFESREIGYRVILGV